MMLNRILIALRLRKPPPPMPLPLAQATLNRVRREMLEHVKDIPVLASWGSKPRELARWERAAKRVGLLRLLVRMKVCKPLVEPVTLTMPKDGSNSGIVTFRRYTPTSWDPVEDDSHVRH